MKEGNRKPNILWIMTDQHKSTALTRPDGTGPDYLSPEKRPHLTPCLGGLARDSYLFDNAYCPSPVCGPSRACMKTGLYPGENGITKNWVPFRKGISFLPQLLRDAGYETGMAGKLHFYPADRDYGFEVCHLSDAPYSVYSDDALHSEYIKWLKAYSFDARGLDPVALFDEDELSFDTDIKRFILGSSFRTKEEHETGWTTERTLDFLKKRDPDRPFFFFTSYFGPHQPYGAPEPYASFCKGEDIELPRSYYQERGAESPVFAGACRTMHDHLQEGLDEGDCRELIAAYLGQVHMIDEEIGRILSYLKENDLYDNTLIVFTSDHGDHLGEHGLFFKEQMYDSCVKVPLIIKPWAMERALEKGKGITKSEPVNTISLFSTLLEAAGVRAVQGAAGRSLLPLLQGREDRYEEDIYSIIGKDKDHLLCMIRQREWKLIRLGGTGEAVYELYNVTEDPEELHNFYEKEEYQSKAGILREKLELWFRGQYEGYE